VPDPRHDRLTGRAERKSGHAVDLTLELVHRECRGDRLVDDLENQLGGLIPAEKTQHYLARERLPERHVGERIRDQAHCHREARNHIDEHRSARYSARLSASASLSVKSSTE
jgi:hypothetical protein